MFHIAFNNSIFFVVLLKLYVIKVSICRVNHHSTCYIIPNDCAMQCLDETDGYTETDCRDSLLRDYCSGKAWIIANNCTRLIQSALQQPPIYI